MDVSLYSYLQQNHPETLAHYLDEMAGIGAAVLDESGRVVCCNRQFGRLTGLEEPIDAHLADFTDLDPATILPPEGQSWSTTLSLASADGDSKDHPTYVVEDGGEYILFCEAVRSDERPILRLSRLNQELGDVNRKLEKKNQALQEAKKTIERMARTDTLTQLANRRYFQERAESVLSASDRHRFPVSVALADLDHFKQINDTYGHDSGDEVLKLFSGILKSSSRTEDLPARWGGEEFVVLMPYTAAEEGCRLTDRVRRRLEEKSSSDMDFTVTASFGVAEYERGMAGPGELVSRADDALYRAKEQGRNRVVIAK
ncbi:MAG: GGDEF domain-containing protein [Planctomycetota bacterium]